MGRARIVRTCAAVAFICGVARPAVAFTTPFHFHCSGDACRAVAFADQGNGCTVVTNHSPYPVHITQGTDQLSYDLSPGETKAPLINIKCYGYYDGGETATFLR